MTKIDLKSVTIIGATGTLGQALLKMLTESWPDVRVTCVSRCEQKQTILMRKFPQARWAIADVRRQSSLTHHVAGRDVVFHVAAMKHVDICEANPEECDLTNKMGTLNVARACMGAKVKNMVFSSTDKAIDPYTQYGHAKASAENYLRWFNQMQTATKFSVYRWGNVLGSQGSVIPKFVESLTNEKKVKLTHPDMTRFWIPIEWAVRYMLRTFPDASRTEAMVPPIMKSASMVDVIEALADLLEIQNYETEIIGIRGKEKLHEAMYSMHDPLGRYLTSETSERYTKQELMEMLLPFVQNPRLAVAA